ncbi:MAG: hypothetical protein SNJ79_01380 [Sphingomonadaceae bacterium]
MAAAEAAMNVARPAFLRVLARVARWRAGLSWIPGQTRTLPLASLSPAQIEALQADHGFECTACETPPLAGGTTE